MVVLATDRVAEEGGGPRKRHRTARPAWQQQRKRRRIVVPQQGFHTDFNAEKGEGKGKGCRATLTGIRDIKRSNI